MRICILLLVSLLATSQPKDPIRILAMGDSITQGGKNSQKEYTYRLPLQMLLRQNGIAYDFIGSRQKGLNEEATWPDVAEGVSFDPDHEGYYGNKTADVCRKVKLAFADYKVFPDIVLIHLGTNDQKSPNPDSAVGAPLRDFIAFARENNPRTVFLLGHLNFNNSTAANQIREVIEKLVADMNTKRSPVQTVHHYRNWHEKPDDVYSDTYDWAHPNLKGQEKMALNWFAAMQPYLKPSN